MRSGIEEDYLLQRYKIRREFNRSKIADDPKEFVEFEIILKETEEKYRRNRRECYRTDRRRKKLGRDK